MKTLRSECVRFSTLPYLIGAGFYVVNTLNALNEEKRLGFMFSCFSFWHFAHAAYFPGTLPEMNQQFLAFWT